LGMSAARLEDAGGDSLVAAARGVIIFIRRCPSEPAAACGEMGEDTSWLLWGDATRMNDARVIAPRARRRLTADIVSVKPVVGGWGG
jgi:hypothetical protein